MMIMIVIVIGLLRTNLSGLYRHRRGLGFTWSRLQGRKDNIRIAKLVFHAKESPIRTQDRVLSLVSSHQLTRLLSLLTHFVLTDQVMSSITRRVMPTWLVTALFIA